MQQQLIEALLYPRKIIEELIREGNYVKKNLFEATGERCNHCDGSGNCGWEHCVEDFQQLRVVVEPFERDVEIDRVMTNLMGGGLAQKGGKGQKQACAQRWN